MKRPRRSVCLPLLFLLLSACASGPASTVKGTFYLGGLPEEVIDSMEFFRFQVKQNGPDIKKYFFLDEENRITVQADFVDETGDYEVGYDLENLRRLDDSAYEVPFRISEKKSGIAQNDVLIWRPEPGASGILLSLDDDHIETWKQYFDLFDRYQSRITFFLQGSVDLMEGKSFCDTALERGHDIGFHTMNHLDLRKVSRDVFFVEAIEPLELFLLGEIPVSAFAYPYGFSEPWMHENLSCFYPVLRGYGVRFRLYTASEIRSGYIISKAIDNTILPGEENFEKTVLAMLRTVKFLDGSWVLPLTTHDISNEAAWGITPGRLEFLLAAARDLRLKFYRYCDFIE